MRRLPLILFMLLITLANLVYAVDGHEGHLEAHTTSDQLDESTGNAPEFCTQAHSCHAHSHVFALVPAFLPERLIEDRHERPDAVPMPEPQTAVPPVPPPIA